MCSVGVLNWIEIGRETGNGEMVRGRDESSDSNDVRLDCLRCRRVKQIVQRAMVLNVIDCDWKVTSMRSGCLSLDHIYMPLALCDTLSLPIIYL
jgi:hypothetical protein